MKSLKDTSSLIKKWECSGLLEYANDPKTIAFCLEYAVTILPESDINQHNGMIIPLVFRIINKIKSTSRRENRKIVKDIIDRFPLFMERNKKIINDLKCFQSIDWEAEMCELFVNEYLLIYEINKTIL